jgi:hypothetical protein
MTYTLTPNVTVTNANTTPVLIKHADNFQLDALGRVKTSLVQDQDWYNSSVDKDGDLRMAEAFYSNIVTTSANGAQTSTTINVVSSTNIYPGAILTAVTGVSNNPQTIVTAVPSGTSVTLNQSVTVTNGETLTFNNYRRTTPATGTQTGVTSLVVGSTTSVMIGDWVTNQNITNQFPINTFVVSITNGTTVVLNQSVTVTNGDTINFDHAKSYFDLLQGDVTLNTGMSANGRVIRQSRIRQRVIPGVSHTIYQTVNFNGMDTNVTKRCGLYDNLNGLYWELDGVGGNLNVVVRRTLPDGSVLEDRIPRTSFNFDKLDGTGQSGFDITSTTTVSITGFSSIAAGVSSGFNVTWNVTSGQGNSFQSGTNVTVMGITPSTYNGTYTIISTTANTVTVNYPINPGTYISSSTPTLYQSQLHKYFTWWAEFIGGRTGRIRFGLGTTAGPTIVHQYSYSGTISTTFVSSANLPKRWEIFNSGSPSYQSTMMVSGNTFNVEAGSTLNPGFGTTTSSITGFAADATLRPIIGFSSRPSFPYNGTDLKLKTICLIDQANRATSGNSNTTAGVYFWSLILNPTISGTAPVPVTTGKASQYYSYSTANAITSNTGTQLAAGYFFGQSQNSTVTISDFLNMGCDVTGYIPDQVVLCVQQVAAGTSTASIVASMNWIEQL